MSDELTDGEARELLEQATEQAVADFKSAVAVGKAGGAVGALRVCSATCPPSTASRRSTTCASTGASCDCELLWNVAPGGPPAEGDQ
jgi:hypothetical protein